MMMFEPVFGSMGNERFGADRLPRRQRRCVRLFVHNKLALHSSDQKLFLNKTRESLKILNVWRASFAATLHMDHDPAKDAEHAEHVQTRKITDLF